MRLAALAVVALVGWSGEGWAESVGLDAVLNAPSMARPPEFNSVHFCNWRTSHQTSSMSLSEADTYTEKCVISEAQAYEDVLQRWRAVDYRIRQGCMSMHGGGEHPSYAELDEYLLD